MTQLDFDSDAFLTLLTDALRAGPGSPQWHEALRTLRAGGIEHADEYRLLVAARQHLESGREYRSIRAGPGFAKRLMTAIDEEAERGTKKPAATTTIAFASAGVMLAVLLIIGYLLWSAGENRGFEPNPLLANIATRTGDRGLPQDWQQIGELKLGVKRGGIGLISASSTSTTSPSTVGASAYWTTPLEPNEQFSISATYRFFRDDQRVIAQLFVTDDPTFDPASGITPHELVWAVQNETARVLVASGRVEAQSNIKLQAVDRSVAIRLTFDRDQVSLEHGSKHIWSGASGLDPNKPKYVGVRFLRLGPTNADNSIFESIQVNTRQK
jgi:hypothetical protein